MEEVSEGGRLWTLMSTGFLREVRIRVIVSPRP